MKNIKLIFTGLFIGWMLSGCVSSSAPPGVIVTTIIPGKIDLTQVVALEGDALYEGIVINKIQDPNRTNKTHMIKASLVDAFRQIESFNIVESDTNINKPSIDVRIDTFEVEKDVVKQGYVTRRGVGRIQFSLISTSGHVVQSVNEFSEINITKVAGAALKSHEYIENRLAKKICKQFVKKMAPSKIREYRTFQKGNSKVNAGIKAAGAENWSYAMQAWETEWNENPKNHAAAYNLGIGYEMDQKHRRAYKMYQEAVSLEPLNKVYSQTLSKMKNKLKAVRHVNEILENVEDESSSSTD